MTTRKRKPASTSSRSGASTPKSRRTSTRSTTTRSTTTRRTPRRRTTTRRRTSSASTVGSVVGAALAGVLASALGGIQWWGWVLLIVVGLVVGLAWAAARGRAALRAEGQGGTAPEEPAR
ncbi:hypothetical protein ACFQ34_09815 [Pseudonocardia benzenivorans]|uniref:Uncharacterized protein n=1 Tax=Pseudonocardia benzenivorans TaxID=228005 RepID=A0ABW3VE51_9PSEU